MKNQPEQPRINLSAQDVQMLAQLGGFFTNLVEENQTLRAEVQRLREALNRQLELLQSLRDNM